MTKTLILSAQGQNSFSPLQLSQVQPSKIHAVPSGISDVDFIKMAKGMHVIALTRRPQVSITKKLLDKLPDLRALCVYSTGLEWIDLSEIERRKILLYSLEDYCSTSVAEHTVGMLLVQSRRLILSDMKSKELIPDSISLRCFEISEKVAGIIGLGRIGLKIADLLSAFGCPIKYHDIEKKQTKYEKVGKKNLLLDSDIVILACPYQGRYEIDEPDLKLMKENAVLVNPSRKDLVNETAVLQHVMSKKLHSYAVDDIMNTTNLEIEHGRILQTHHTAWYSDEVLRRGTQMWVNNICKAQKRVLKNAK